MFKTFFGKVGKAAFTAAQGHTSKQKMFKGPGSLPSQGPGSFKVMPSFSPQGIECQGM